MNFLEKTIEASWLFYGMILILGYKLGFRLFLSGVDSAVKRYFKARLLPIYEDFLPLKEGLCALLSHYLRQEMKGYLERGELSLLERDELSLFYQTYEALGGNGTAKALYEACQSLPFQREEEEDAKN